MRLFTANNSTVHPSWRRRRETVVVGKIIVPLQQIREPITLAQFGGLPEAPAIQYLDITGTSSRQNTLLYGEDDRNALVLWEVLAGRGGSVSFDTSHATKVIATDTESGRPPRSVILAVLAPGDSITVQRKGRNTQRMRWILSYDGTKVAVTTPPEAAGTVIIRLHVTLAPVLCDPRAAFDPDALRKGIAQAAEKVPLDSKVVLVGNSNALAGILFYQALLARGCTIQGEFRGVRLPLSS